MRSRLSLLALTTTLALVGCSGGASTPEADEKDTQSSAGSAAESNPQTGAQTETESSLVDPADADALAANMEALCAAPDEERAEMGRQAFAYYQDHYRRRAVLDRLEEFILRGNCV